MCTMKALSYDYGDMQGPEFSLGGEPALLHA
jgi:hypothetical protein